RSLIFQIEELAMHFADLPGNKETLSAENKFLLEATTALKLSDVADLAKADTGVRQNLDQILARIQYLIGSAAKAISQRYFDHAQGPQLLVKNTEWQDHL
ncbi:MAG: alpha-E domain-containing protein, partial [Cellvibrio sp.]